MLAELLNHYSLYGLPAMPELLTIGKPQFDDKVFELESHWTDIVEGHEVRGLDSKFISDNHIVPGGTP